MQWFKVPPKIYFENDSIQYLQKMEGIERAFIVTDPTMVKLGNVDKILYYLRRREHYCHAEIYSDVEPDPDVSTIMRGVEIMRQFQPDVVVGTGGYVSGPVLRQAARMGFRTVTHESNAYPGMTTRLIAKTADKVLLAVPEAAAHLECRREPIVTGSPVREEILFADRAAAREKLGVGDRVCILSFGGSLGAERINRAMAEVVAHFAPTGRTHHIHATGAYGTELFPECLRELGADITGDPHMDIREYIRDMADCLAAADLVICRSGAMTLTELEAAGRASILIPSPNVAENHQYHNAMVLAEHGAAVVIEEKDLTGERLCQTIEELLSDPAHLTELGKKAASLARLDANERISREILELAQEPAKA